MPSLRKRQSRTSTPFSSPYETPVNSSEQQKRSKIQSSLDTWIEPPPKNPVPSFEEHGFARHGVLETMSALGVPPSSKMKQRARTLTETSARRSALTRNGNISAAEDGVSTPEVTPAPEVDREESEKQEEEETHTKLPELEEDEDDDWVPAKTKVKTPTGKATGRSKTPVQTKSPVLSKSPMKNGASRDLSPSNSPVAERAASLPSDVAGAAPAQRLQIIVNDAVQRSLAANNPVIGTVLRHLHEDGKTNPRSHEMLEAVLRSNATPEQHEAFRQYIKTERRRVKEDARARKAEAAMESESMPNSPSKSKASIKSNIGISENATQALNDIATHEMSSSDQDISGAPARSQAASNPLGLVPHLPAHASSSSQPSRRPSKSPRKRQALNKDMQNGDAETSTKATTTGPQTPDSVLGSDSDLSDVNEEIVQNGPPESLKRTRDLASIDAPVGPAAKKPKTAPTARAGKKSRANSAKPNGKNVKKAQPSAPEEPEDPVVLQQREQKRKEMEADQPVRQMDQNFPLSDTRFDDEILETESLTESQIAVGPPMKDDSKPRRAGRNSRNVPPVTGKRHRDDALSMLSPQPDSRANTRPSTPSFPPSKRAKATAARTKKS